VTEPAPSPPAPRSYPPIKPVELAAAALRSVSQSFGPLLPVWVGLTVLNLAAFVGLGWWLHGHPAVDDPAVNAVSGLVSGVGDGGLSALAVRVFAGRTERIWRVDLGLVAYVAAQVACALAEALLPGLAVRATGLAAASGAGMAVALGAWFLIVLVEVRISLWQVGLLMADPRIGPWRSWRAMDGAMVSYVTTYFLIAGPAALVYALSWSAYGELDSPLALGVAVASYCALVMLTAALSAHLYRIRLGGAARATAAVFE
jgi:hypothetical protein